MSKFIPKAKDGKIAIEYDGNADGEASVKMSIVIDEATQEMFKKGQAVEGEAKVKFKMSPSGELSLQLDTDQDGEPSVMIEADVMEALEEANVL